MSISYSVNGAIVCHGVTSDWQRQVTRTELDGSRRLSPVATNRWTVPLLEATAFDALRALQGTALTSLQTNDMLARDTAASYTEVTLGLVQGAHVGHLLTNVTLDFSVVTAGAFGAGFDGGFA
jgi:hypothetical protein